MRGELARTTERLAACESAKRRLDEELREANARAELLHQLELTEALDALKSEKERAEHEVTSSSFPPTISVLNARRVQTCEWRRRAAEYEARCERTQRELEAAEQRCDAALTDANALRDSIRKGSIHQKLLQLDKQHSHEVRTARRASWMSQRPAGERGADEAHLEAREGQRAKEGGELASLPNASGARAIAEQFLSVSLRQCSPDRWLVSYCLRALLPSRPPSFPSLFDELEADDSSQAARKQTAVGADAIVEFFYMVGRNRC